VRIVRMRMRVCMLGRGRVRGHACVCVHTRARASVHVCACVRDGCKSRSVW